MFKNKNRRTHLFGKIFLPYVSIENVQFITAHIKFIYLTMTNYYSSDIIIGIIHIFPYPQQLLSRGCPLLRSSPLEQWINVPSQSHWLSHAIQPKCDL